MTALRIGIDTRLHGRGLGIATYIDELAAALAARPDVDEVVRLGNRALLDPALTARLLRSLRLDVLHFPANIGWLRRGPIPHVLTVHDAIFLDARGRTTRQLVGRAAMRALVPRSLSAACEVVTVSDVAREELRRLGAAGPVHVCPHGAPSDIVVQDGPRTAVLVFAATDPRKGTALALDTWEAALPGLPAQTELHLLTAAGLDDGDARRAAGLARVRIVGRLDRPELTALLGSARALLHTSVAEGFGLPVLEAMVGGTVVVGGLAPSVRWLAQDALANPAGTVDPAGLAAALVDVCSDDARAADLRARGRRRASQFTWSASASLHLTAYRAAVERWSTRPGSGSGAAA